MPLGSKVLYEFDQFRLNPADHSLLCGEKPVSLTPKSFDILVTLIERNGQLVTKDESMKKIWPDSFVEEANLTVNVSALRKALGDTPEHQQYIETVPKLGYRFTARVTARNGSLAPVVEIPKSADAPEKAIRPTRDRQRQFLQFREPSDDKKHRWILFAAAAALVLLAAVGFTIFRSVPG